MTRSRDPEIIGRYTTVRETFLKRAGTVTLRTLNAVIESETTSKDTFTRLVQTFPTFCI